VPADRLERFAKGSIVYRVHPDPYSPVGEVIRFNDSDCGNARFSPIRDGAGKIIPTLYAGTTLNCAFMESVFHDVPIGAGPTSIDPTHLDLLVCSEVETLKELLLIDLTSTGLRHFGLKNTDLIDTDADTYPGPTHINEPILLYANRGSTVTRGYGQSPEVFCRVA